MCNIDDAIVYNTTRAHSEVRGGTFLDCTDGLANHNTLGQLTNQSPSRISEGGAS